MRSAKEENMIPSSSEIVPVHTSSEVNESIREDLHRRAGKCVGAGPAEITQALEDLDREWDIERAIEANAASLSLAGVAHSALHTKKWMILPDLVAGFLLQHAIQGWRQAIF